MQERKKLPPGVNAETFVIKTRNANIFNGRYVARSTVNMYRLNALFQNNSSEKKRYCLLKKVGFKNKKGFVSGERFCGTSM